MLLWFGLEVKPRARRPDKQTTRLLVIRSLIPRSEVVNAQAEQEGHQWIALLSSRMDNPVSLAFTVFPHVVFLA